MAFSKSIFLSKINFWSDEVKARSAKTQPHRNPTQQKTTTNVRKHENGWAGTARWAGVKKPGVSKYQRFCCIQVGRRWIGCRKILWAGTPAGSRNAQWTIDKLLRKRRTRFLVRWIGYGPEHDSCIEASKLQNVWSFILYHVAIGCPHGTVSTKQYNKTDEPH